jgi:hypothetical protein
VGRVAQPTSSLGLPVPPPPEPPPRPPKRHKTHLTAMPSTRTVTPVPTPVDSPPKPDVLASLGKLIRDHSNLFKTLGWQQFITTLQQPRDTASYLHRLPHPAAPFLHRISSIGIPAPSSSAPWTMSHKRHHYQWGAHYWASAQYRTFLWEDMLDMVRKGYWTILPFHLVK